ncbi:MAG: phosphorylase [Methylococcaceae bacterium]|nr:MAG: phosphorylase [Methylococcaceae bacterium]
MGIGKVLGGSRSEWREAGASRTAFPSGAWEREEREKRANTGIIVALPVECRSLGVRLRHKGDGVRLPSGVRVMLSGAGPDNARRAAETLIEQGANALVSWGCCAALQPELRPGDLLLPEAVWADGVSYAIDPAVRQHWREGLNLRQTPRGGLLVQSASIVADAAAKRALAQRTGALAVDMESGAVAQAADAHNLPCLVLRAVADPLDFTLPSSVLDNTDADGNTSLPGLLLSLACHPGQLPALLALGRHFGAAMDALKQAAGTGELACRKT